MFPGFGKFNCMHFPLLLTLNVMGGKASELSVCETYLFPAFPAGALGPANYRLLALL